MVHLTWALKARYLSPWTLRAMAWFSVTLCFLKTMRASLGIGNLAIGRFDACRDLGLRLLATMG